MTKKILTAILLLAALPAQAQQVPQDPQIAIYRQLLDSANAQLVAVAVALQQEQAKSAALQKELDELKAAKK